MKIFNRLFSVILFVALMGCNNDDTQTAEMTIPLDPTKKYIHFDAEVSTRGALIEGNVLQDHFNVLGYQYRGEWTNEKVFASPNVFSNTPQTVRYESSVFSYGTPIAWSGNTYSFFGYYPTGHNSIKLFDDGTKKTGEPYITFTLPISSDPRDLIDVMTASYIDTGVASNASVGLEFHHRLSAIDVGARNYYEYDHDGNPSTEDKLVTIEIVNLAVNLTNVVNTSAKIYLDHDIPSVYPENQAKISISYKIVDKDATWALDKFDVTPNTPEDRSFRLVTTQTGENASSILLIPQTEFLYGALALTYKKWYINDVGVKTYLHEGDNVNDFEFNPNLPINFSKPLIEGRRYYIELTFTSDAISVNIISADEWDVIKVDEDENIRHEFQ